MLDIRIMKNEEEFDRAAAWEIIGQMLRKPHSVIGLSTGQTTKNMHAIVSDIYRQYPFDTSRVTLFNVDELTLGIRTIMHARRIVLVAKGSHKAEMVRQMLKGPVTEDIPASVLQLHPNCTFLLDAEAGRYVADMEGARLC